MITLLYEGDAVDTEGDRVDVTVSAPAHILVFEDVKSQKPVGL
jgi:hypothetical protein